MRDARGLDYRECITEGQCLALDDRDLGWAYRERLDADNSCERRYEETNSSSAFKVPPGAPGVASALHGIRFYREVYPSRPFAAHPPIIPNTENTPSNVIITLSRFGLLLLLLEYFDVLHRSTEIVSTKSSQMQFAYDKSRLPVGFLLPTLY
ncbi:hypothetical protein V1478_009842 [Vespula squamosa]|uniref:Uncharacterized protein n=1 Tax=Vespula squamosa TaxID=30214 RepID=A0ABD2AJL2_VESSQ